LKQEQEMQESEKERELEVACAPVTGQVVKREETALVFSFYLLAH
jgi:hypothetical protein